jgi:multidrug efflux pump
MPPALPGGGQFPIELVLLSTEEPERMLDFAKQLQGQAMESKSFFFPPIIDTKIDQPQAELVIDHDKVAALGLNLQQIGADISAAVGGNFVNRFNIAGRSYKVIPQIKRSERLNPEQLKEIYVTGPDNKLIPLSTVATIKESTVPRSLNRMQQLNAVTISGMSSLPIDQALRLLEDEAAKILPKGYTLDYTGESRQLRVEGDKFLPAFGLAVVLIFLVLAAQFNSFRDPLIILLGSVPLALFGALIFTFLKMPAPNVPFFTNGWTTTMNIYSQVGLVTLVGLIAKNAILIVEFANKLQEEGKNKLAAISEASRIRLRPVLMTTIATVAGHMPLIFVSGAGAKARNSIGLVLVGGMTIGTLFTLFIVPSLYVLIAKNHNTAPRGSDADDDGGDEGDAHLEHDDAGEAAPQLEEPALARKRVDGAGGDGHGVWQPA